MGALFNPQSNQSANLGAIYDSGQAPGGPPQSQLLRQRIASKLAYLNGQMTPAQQAAAAKPDIADVANQAAAQQAQKRLLMGQGRKSTFLSGAAPVAAPPTSKSVTGY